LADGTSKKTISLPSFSEYLIEYVPPEKQLDFLKVNVDKLSKLKKELAETEKKIKAELIKQEAMFHCFFQVAP
jgi:hypothetical protein